MKPLSNTNASQTFHLTEREGTLQNSFNKANITLTSKLSKNKMKQKLQTNFHDECRCKISQKNACKLSMFLHIR